MREDAGAVSQAMSLCQNVRHGCVDLYLFLYVYIYTHAIEDASRSFLPSYHVEIIAQQTLLRSLLIFLLFSLFVLQYPTLLGCICVPGHRGDITFHNPYRVNKCSSVGSWLATDPEIWLRHQKYSARSGASIKTVYILCT
jgi:hypothetical protein